MKKIILALVAATFTLVAQAQIVGSRTVGVMYEQPEPRVSSTIWYLRAGASLDNIGGDVDDTSAKIGYQATIGFQKPILDEGLYWGMEAGLGSRGYKVDNKHYDVTITQTMHSVLFSPLNLGWKIDLTDGLKLDPHIGGYASYDFAGSVSVSDGYTYNGDWDDDLQKFDAGMNIGVGLWINDKFNIDFQYRHGFVNMNDDNDDYVAHSNRFLLSLGIAL